ncbi:MAG: hypothetical protein ACPL7B_03375 [Candidatus Poribacteria bacterium]
MNKIWAIFIISILIAGCGALNASRNINPIPDENVTILKRTKGVATEKNNIIVAVVPLQDVKELDGFGVIIVNKTPNWISIRKEECMLVQDGKVIYPLDQNKALARLGAGYKPKMPNELNADIYEWRKEINTIKSSANTKVVDEDKKISIITGSKETLYLYFNTQGNTSPMQIILPNIFNESTKEKTSFSFRFEITKK